MQHLELTELSHKRKFSLSRLARKVSPVEDRLKVCTRITRQTHQGMYRFFCNAWILFSILHYTQLRILDTFN